VVAAHRCSVDDEQAPDLLRHPGEDRGRRRPCRDQRRHATQSGLLVRDSAVADFAHPQAFLGALPRPDLVPQLVVMTKSSAPTASAAAV
jgi:hypothetical protein